MNRQSEIVEQYFIKDKSAKEYIVFKHADKTWILPSDSIGQALSLYQPSTWKGKALKYAVRFGKGNKIGERIHLKKKRIRLKDEILERIEEITELDRNEFEVAVYMGDTSSWQNEKVTLQVYDRNEIFCYLKLTENERVSKNFNHEIRALNYLEEKKLLNVPHVLMNEKNNGIHYFAQSTESGFNESPKLDLSNKQLDFLWDINQKTAKKLNYEEAEFAYYVEYLKSHKDDFKDWEKEVLERGISWVEQRLKEEPYIYSFFHGDFTPWNVYYKNGELKAFDFEYAHFSMPEYMDVFHFITQASMLGWKAQAGGVIHEYRRCFHRLERYVGNPDFTYTCYLLFVMSFYMMRTEDALKVLNDKFKVWIEVLDYLTENHK